MRRAGIRSALCSIALGLLASAGCGEDRLPRFARPPSSDAGPSDAGPGPDEDAGPSID